MQKSKKTEAANFEQLIPFIDEQLRTLSASINTLLTMVPQAQHIADADQNYEVIGVTNRGGTLDFTTEKVSDLAKSILLRKGIKTGSKVSILNKSQNQPVSLIELSQLFQRQLDSIIATFNSLVDMCPESEDLDHTGYEVVVSRIEDGERIYTNADASTLAKSKPMISRERSTFIAKQLKKAMRK